MKNKFNFLSCLLGVIILTTAGTVSASVYNPTDQFSTSDNPSGVWSYGWMPTDFSSFNRYTETWNHAPFGGSAAWYDPNVGTNRHIWKNETSNAYYDVLPGQIALHPGNAHEASVLRFTAETIGLFDIQGEFLGGDIGSMLLGVRQGTDWLWQGVNAGSFSITDYQLDAGQSVDFLVYGGYTSGTTPLELTITSDVSISEPGNILLLSIGFTGLLGVGLRKKRFAPA